jgi:hypothetical protein
VPSVLGRLPTLAGDIIRDLHQQIETRALRSGASAASFHILKQSIPGYKETLKDAVAISRNAITERQRDINREFVPVIAEHMLDAYEGCVAECGPGSYMRMKSLMAGHVDTERHEMFNLSAKKVENLLRILIQDVEKILLAKADEVFLSLKRDYTRVVLGTSNTKQLPREQRQMRREVLETLEGTEIEFKSVLGLEPEEEEDNEGAKTASKATEEINGGGNLDNAATVASAISDDAEALPAEALTQDPPVIEQDATKNERSATETESSVDEAGDKELGSPDTEMSESNGDNDTGSEVTYTSDEF